MAGRRQKTGLDVVAEMEATYRGLACGQIKPSTARVRIDALARIHRIAFDRELSERLGIAEGQLKRFGIAGDAK